MSQIMKAFTGIYMILLMMVVSAGILSAFLQVLHAQNMHAAIINEMENSNYAVSVVKEGFAVSEEAGYSIEMVIYYEDKAPVKYKSKKSLPNSLQGVSMAEVRLSYPFKIPFLDINLEQQLFGYAR